MAIGVFLAFYAIVYIIIPSQGWIWGALPDTSWIQSDSRIYYSEKEFLYSIKINGQEKRKIVDNIHLWNISPDDNKMVSWNRIKSSTTDSREVWSDIEVIDLKTGQRTVVEQKTDCGVPMWLPGGTRIVYELSGQQNGFCVFDVINGNRKFVSTNELIADMMVTKGGDVIFSKLYSKKVYKYNASTGLLVELRKFRDMPRGWTLYEYIEESEEYLEYPDERGLAGGGLLSYDKTLDAYPKDGSLWLKGNGQDQRIVRYLGIYESLLTYGASPSAWSKDSRYLVFDFREKLYVYDLKLNKFGFLTKGAGARFKKE